MGNTGLARPPRAHRRHGAGRRTDNAPASLVNLRSTSRCRPPTRCQASRPSTTRSTAGRSTDLRRARHVSAEGTHTIPYAATDVAGNIEATQDGHRAHRRDGAGIRRATSTMRSNATATMTSRFPRPTHPSVASTDLYRFDEGVWVTAYTASLTPTAGRASQRSSRRSMDERRIYRGHQDRHVRRRQALRGDLAGPGVRGTWATTNNAVLSGGASRALRRPAPRSSRRSPAPARLDHLAQPHLRQGTGLPRPGPGRRGPLRGFRLQADDVDERRPEGRNTIPSDRKYLGTKNAASTGYQHRHRRLRHDRTNSPPTRPRRAPATTRIRHGAPQAPR